MHPVYVYMYMQLLEKHGPEAEQHLFRCLINIVDFDGKGGGKDGQQLQLLMQESMNIATRPNFVSILCNGFENQDNKVQQIDTCN